MSRLPDRTSLSSPVMAQMFAVILLFHLGFFIAQTSAAQKFYPNGRYGRRSVLPALMPSVDSSEDVITFIGNVASSSGTSKLSRHNRPLSLSPDQPITLLCFPMGRSDQLRCVLRESSADVLERNNNESQQ